MPGIDTLKLFAKYAPYQLFRYGMDWSKQNNLGFEAVHAWEDKEPGSLQAILNAYAHVVPLIESQKRFSIEDICSIHYHCTQDVELNTPTNNDNADHQLLQDSYPGIFRGFGPFCGGMVSGYSLSKNTCSEQGFNELKALWLKGDIYIHVDPSALVDRATFLSVPGKVCGYMAELTINDLAWLENDINTLQLMESLFHSEISPLSAITAFANYKELIDKKIEQWQINFTYKLNEILDAFYAELEIIPNEDSDAKLKAIVSVVQCLERAHPFFDANTRTFCIVLLNALLMQHGFEPTLLDNPNKFDGFAVEELVDLVKSGIERTIELSGYVKKLKRNTLNQYFLLNDKNTPMWMNVPLEERAYAKTFASAMIHQFQLEKPRSNVPQQTFFFNPDLPILANKNPELSIKNLMQ